jgi:hypothetical protein
VFYVTLASWEWHLIAADPDLTQIALVRFCVFRSATHLSWRVRLSCSKLPSHILPLMGRHVSIILFYILMYISSFHVRRVTS